jgi:chitinase
MGGLLTGIFVIRRNQSDDGTRSPHPVYWLSIQDALAGGFSLKHIRGQRQNTEIQQIAESSNAVIHARTARSFAVIALAVGLCIGHLRQAGAAQHTEGPAVIAYVFPNETMLQPGDVAARKLTRINYAFSNIDGNRMVIGAPVDVQNLATLVGLKKENPSLTVLVSVGGWLWSGGFSDMSLTHESRTAFIQSVVEFLKQYQLDGLDIDWEYPAMEGSTKHFRPEDTQNYTLLLAELRSRFDTEEKLLHRRLYLSIAVGGEHDFIEHTEMGKVQKYVDTVNLMAYDYYEPGSEPITGNQAPLFANPADPKKISAARSIEDYEQAGVPAEKIVLGVPFYGHAWGQVPGENHGLFQPGKKAPNTYARYGNIVSSMLKQGYTRYWDATASAPYLYNPEKRIFVSYEDPESLTLKCKYVLDHKLAGVMFWDYESDPTGMLLDTIDQQFHLNAAPAAASGTGAR